MAIQQASVETFLSALASKAATPGGGSAAAVLGAISAALTSMVCNLTIGKKKYAEVEPEMTDILERAGQLRASLLDAIEEDVAAFDGLMAAYGLPKGGESEQAARALAIQVGLRHATEAPLACARLCREAIALASVVSARGNAAVISDGGVAAVAAEAGLRASALNVLVNTKAIEDRDFAEVTLATLDALLAEAVHEANATYESVAARLR